MESLKIILAIIATPFLALGIIYAGLFFIKCFREIVYLTPFILAFVIIIGLFQIEFSDTALGIFAIGIIIATVLMAIFHEP